MIKLPPNQTLRRILGRCMGLTLIALMIGFAPALRAEDTGTVTGLVLDTTTGKYVEGAEIYVDGTLLIANTERGGTFIIKSVPVGSRTLVVTYPGLEIKNETVEVKTGETANVTIRLGSEVLMLEAVSVSTAKEGMAQAQALQKVSLQSKIIAANDQFGEIAEGNIGEYLKFLPGVGIDYNSNDARGVSLRGLKTQFTIVAVDDTPMASASSGNANRRFELEQIAMNNVETTEIYKTVTPDISADSTGGYVNMVTKSAFDREDPSVFTYNLSLNVPSTRFGAYKESGTWGQGRHSVIRPSGELNYARRINDKIGFNVNYRYSDLYNDSPRAEYTWRTTGTGFSVADPTLASFTMSNEQKLTHRESFATKLDYKISDSTKLTISGQWNWYDLTFTQRRMIYTLGATGQANPVGANLSTSGTSGFGIDDSFQQRNKYGTTMHGNAKLEHDFSSDSKIWAVGYWSKANSKYRDSTKGFTAESTARLNGVTSFFINNVIDNERTPAISISGSSLTNSRSLTNYTFTGNNSTNFRSRPTTGHDMKAGGRLNYSYSLDTFVPLKFQVGTAYDNVKREIVTQELRVITPSTLTGAALASYKEENLFNFGFGYGPTETLDPYRLYTDFFAPGNKLLQSDTYSLFEENNVAGYGLVDAKFFHDLQVVAGARWEKHTTDIYGINRSPSAAATARPYINDLEYDKAYPSVMARYNPSFEKRLVIRAGASKTVGHPDYVDLLGSVTINGGGVGTITLVDPNLKPYYVNNYDFSVEFYPNKSGVIAATVFKKDVSGFIVSKTLPVTDAQAQQLLVESGYTLSDFINSTGSPVTLRYNSAFDSHLTGIELQYNQNFSFLPKPFKGLSLQTNYTKVDVDSDDLATQYEQELSAVTEAINVIVGYRLGKFNSTISTNWTGDVLITNASPLLSYKSPEMKTSINVSYSVNSHYTIYAEARNIFYEREEYFKGYAVSDRAVELPGRSFEYGDPIYVLGVKGRF